MSSKCGPACVCAIARMYSRLFGFSPALFLYTRFCVCFLVSRLFCRRFVLLWFDVNRPCCCCWLCCCCYCYSYRFNSHVSYAWLTCMNMINIARHGMSWSGIGDGSSRAHVFFFKQIVVVVCARLLWIGKQQPKKSQNKHKDLIIRYAENIYIMHTLAHKQQQHTHPQVAM